jgi:hypothetical protein
MLRSGTRVTVCSLVLALVALGAALPVAHAQAPPSNPDLLRELAMRLLSQPSGPPGALLPVQLLPGALPPDLPLSLPMPDGSRLIGSAVHPQFPSGRYTDVVLDVPGRPAQVLTFYRTALATLGWTEPNSKFRAPGFQPDVPVGNDLFCAGPTGPWLGIMAYGQATGVADVRIMVHEDFPGPCPSSNPGPGAPPGPFVGAESVPSLDTPPGVQVLSTAVGAPVVGGGMSIFISAGVAISDEPADAIEAAYADQLTVAGWTMTDSGSDGLTAWSAWTLPGPVDQTAFLSVTAVPGSNQRALHLQVSTPGQG